MKILGLSDLHGYRPATDLWPAADVAVIAGDIVPATAQYHGTSATGRMRQAEWMKNEFIPWLSTIPVKHVVMTWGNHDWCADQPGGSLIPDSWWPEHCHMLVNRGITIDGVHFYGVPQTPRFYDWAFNEDDNERSLGLRWDAVDPETDVLISHGPPFGAVDWVGTRSKGERVGSVTLRRWLEAEEQRRPSVVVCGHIHEAGGMRGCVNNTSIVNVALVDERYKLCRTPMVIEVHAR